MSKIITKFIVLVLPVAELFCPIRFGKDCVKQLQLYRNHLFVVSGRLFKREDVYATLQATTKKYFGVEINISTWRHFMKVLFEHYLHKRSELVDELTEDDDPGSHVFGHSQKVGESEYAILDTSAPTQRRSSFMAMQELAYDMHKFLGISDESNSTQKESNSNADVPTSGSLDDASIDMICNVRRIYSLSLCTG